MTDTRHIHSQTFRKDEHLVREKIIEEVYQQGSTVKLASFVLIYQVRSLPTGAPAQVMLAVPKRLYRLAHERNRIRRLMREAYRKNKAVHGTPLDERKLQAAVILIFTGRQMPDAAYVHGKIKELLKRFASVITTEYSNNQPGNESTERHEEQT